MTDNELIAEFMDEGFIREKNWHRIHWKDMPFNSSWDWLMPVVEKIQTPEVNNDVIIRESADVTIFYKNCHIEYMTDDLDYDLHPDGVQGETKIEAVYKAVVEFIKWYNQNK